MGLALLAAYIKKRKFNGDIALRYLVWYGAGRFWIEALRTDSLLLVPSIGLRVSQLVAGIAVVGGVIAEILLTKKFRDKPLDGRAAPEQREPGTDEKDWTAPLPLRGRTLLCRPLHPARSSLRKRQHGMRP